MRKTALPLLLAALLAGPLAACAPSTEPMLGKPSHHTVDGGFRNPPGSPPREAGYGDFIPFFLTMLGHAHPPVPPEHVLNPEAVAQGRAAMASRDHATWLGHASFLLRFHGAHILTDPFLGDRAGPLGFGPKRYVPPALTPEQLPPLDLIIVSHNHYDHLDAGTVERLQNKERITAVVPLKLGAFFRSRGYTNVVELDWYDSVERNGVKITAVPAIHFSRRGLFDMNKTLWAGYVLEADGKKVYFSGDTTYGPVFKEVGQKLGPIDLALVAIGAYEPQKIMKPSHVTPEEAVSLGRDIGAKRLVGMHWGTIILTLEPPFEPPLRFRAAGQAAGYDAAAIELPKIGETLAF